MSATQGNYLFLGAGGMGMAPLAGWMVQAGYSVSGYDDYLQEPVRRYLESSGVQLYEFLFEGQLDAYDVIVYSSALPAEHRLLTAAHALGKQVIRRGELLAWIAQERRLIAVAGSHGKTTTSGMIAYALDRMQIDVDYILGGFPASEEMLPSRFSGSEWLIAEIDESDGTIGGFEPEWTLLLNADWDHPDYYPDEESLLNAFGGLLARTKQHALLPEKSEKIEAIAAGITAKIDFYWEACGKCTESADYDAHNRAAALALLRLLPGGEAVRETTFEAFPGMARRRVLLYETEALRIIEDYAHHPAEMDALLSSIRLSEGNRRIIIVFQPHRFSRTREFKADFVKSLRQADHCFLLPLYGAHEAVVEGGQLKDLMDAFGSEVPEVLTMDLSGASRLSEAIGPGATTVVFAGAGTIDHFAAVFTSITRNQGKVAMAWADYLNDRINPECLLKYEEPMAGKTTMRVGGNARYYAEPSNLCDLRALIRAAALFGLEVFCLGRGSNLIIADTGFNGLVIRFSAPSWRRVESIGEGALWAAAGVRLKEICGYAAKAGLSGFEFLEGVPGALGGSLRMNAGAMGNWIFDVVDRVQMLDAEGRFEDLPAASFNFGYRKVEEISKGIALGAVLRSPVNGEPGDIRDRMDSYSSLRKSSQPREPSAGCIFKNPEGNHAGKLIDESGLKGLRVGGAEVSTVHGNFIVNKGGATASDIIELVRRVRLTVLEHSGYELEPEVLLLGATWPEILQAEEVTDNA